MATQDDYIRTALRVPSSLHRAIHESAAVGNRTFNAELIARLQGSFDFVKLLPPMVQDAMATAAEDSGISQMEALEKLVLAGQSQGGQVLNLKIAPGTTAKEVRDALNVALKLAPDADLVFEREPKA